MQRFSLWIDRVRLRNKSVPLVNDETTDEDSDGDALEEKMLKALNKEKQTLRNWKTIMLRV
jgi:hypothetical protein